MKADCTAHTISGMGSVDDSKTLFITTQMLQFHSTANITKQMPHRRVSAVVVNCGPFRAPPT